MAGAVQAWQPSFVEPGESFSRIKLGMRCGPAIPLPRWVLRLRA